MFKHNGEVFKTSILEEAGKHAIWNEEFELYGLEQAIYGPPLVIGSYDEDPNGVELLGELRAIEYRDLLESTEEVKHKMEMTDSKGKITG